MKILVAEDDPHTREGLLEILDNEGYQAIGASDGTQALELFKQQQPDFVCLDIMMPGMSGYDLCRTLRADHPELPIVFISAKSEEIDKVLGLELGADDFIIKPFGVREVIARIRAVARRALQARPANTTSTGFQMGDLLVEPDALRARRGDQVFDLNPRDLCILRLLKDNPGRVLRRDEIFDHCWGRNYLPSSRSLDQHISQLRKRIELDPGNPKIVRTVHGVGYRFEAD
jgi:DNA-binding response OmpR family regulator